MTAKIDTAAAFAIGLLALAVLVAAGMAHAQGSMPPGNTAQGAAQPPPPPQVSAPAVPAVPVQPPGAAAPGQPGSAVPGQTGAAVPAPPAAANAPTSRESDFLDAQVRRAQQNMATECNALQTGMDRSRCDEARQRFNTAVGERAENSPGGQRPRPCLAYPQNNMPVPAECR